MFFNGETCEIENDDQCFDCRYFVENDGDQTRCPLYNALSQGIVNLNDTVTIEGCKLHVPSIH